MKKNKFIWVAVLIFIAGLILGIAGANIYDSWQISSCQRDCQDAVIRGDFDEYCKDSADKGLCLEYKKNQCELNCYFK